MRVEHYPWNYDLDARFPHQHRIFAFEGGCVATADAHGKFYILIDEGTMADFLLPDDPSDAEVLARLKTVMEFDMATERDATLAEIEADHEAARRRLRVKG